MELRAKVLKYLERNPSDFITLSRNLDIETNELADEINNLLKAGYLTKANEVFHLTDRAREYLKIEESET